MGNAKEKYQGKGARKTFPEKNTKQSEVFSWDYLFHRSRLCILSRPPFFFCETSTMVVWIKGNPCLRRSLEIGAFALSKAMMRNLGWQWQWQI